MAHDVEVSAPAINVIIPESLRWNDSRRGEEFTLSSRTIRRCRTDGSPRRPAGVHWRAGAAPHRGPG
jgi:hypothetical protein